jgi:hypothetical protein
MQDATVQVLREAIERSTSMNFGRCFGGKNGGHHGITFVEVVSFGGLFHLCWKGITLELLHV